MRKRCSSAFAAASPMSASAHTTTLAEAKTVLQHEGEFDLVLLDLWLPATHGYDGLIELRRLFPKLPIVIVSAFANENVVEKAIICGAAGFIPKIG